MKVTPPTLEALLLEILAAGPAHGYAVMTTLREASGGGLDFPEGTVYPALHRLERQGLAASAAERVDGRVRRIYALTGDGRSARAEARASWTRYAQAMQSVLGPVAPVGPVGAGGAA